jgi:diguanylate cyclase (GGDEF)-like protein
MMRKEDIKIQLLINLLREVSYKYEALFNLKEDLISDIEFKATHDSLTGLYNRSAFFDLVKREIERLKRGENRIVCIAFVDLDNFKRVNDEFGHEEGDRVLSKFGEILAKGFRKYDIVARFGGDEFVIALINCKDAGRCTCPAFRKFKKRVERELCEYRLTVSIGVVKAPDDGVDIDRLISEADRRMYKAKRLGKNRICNFKGCIDD